MITMLRNLKCYCPNYIGVKDVLIVRDTIFKITEPNTIKSTSLIEKELDCTNLIATPGFIDGHVHIIGGGGEEGFGSFNKEISVNEIISCGVTTVVGVLGADKDSKNLYHLLTKARELEKNGLTTFIYTGSYTVPVKTFTADITSDLTLIDKVIGVGEIAISDIRSSHPTVQELTRIASDTYLGGLLSGKAGVLHFHLGDGKGNLFLLNEMLKTSDLPKSMFLPTHINRNKKLFNDGVKYAKNGGFIDLTAGEKIGLSVKDSIIKLIEEGVDLNLVTVSSDANASTPTGMAKMKELYLDIMECISAGVDVEMALSLITKNVADRIIKNKKIGQIKEGYVASINLFDNDFELVKVISNGMFLKN